MTVSVKLTGLKETVRNLQKAVDASKIAGRDGLIRLGLEIKRGSMQKVPVDQGNLRASHYVAWKNKTENPAPAFKSSALEPKKASKLSAGHATIVTKATSKLGELDVEVGVSAFYAIIQHEDLELRHRVGEAKFLEKSVGEASNRAQSIVGNVAKRQAAKTYRKLKPKRGL